MAEHAAGCHPKLVDWQSLTRTNEPNSVPVVRNCCEIEQTAAEGWTRHLRWMALQLSLAQMLNYYQQTISALKMTVWFLTGVHVETSPVQGWW